VPCLHGRLVGRHVAADHAAVKAAVADHPGKQLSIADHAKPWELTPWTPAAKTLVERVS
jgi:hypothetical protein